MLSERNLHLLTAAVDGELTAHEERAVQRLLRESPAAREYYRQLRRDAERIRNLAAPALPANFSSEVLQSIGARCRHPNSGVRLGQRWLPVSANVAAAAAVALALAAGIFVIISRTEPENPTANRPIASQAQPELIGRPRAEMQPRVIESEPELLAKAPATVGEAEPATTNTPPTTGNALTSAPGDRPEFIKVEPPKTVATVVNFREITESRDRLRSALREMTAIRIDLFSRDPNRAMERFQLAMQSLNKPLLADGIAAEANQRRLRIPFAVYSESLSVDDILRLSQALAADDAKAEPKRESVFDTLVVMPFSIDDQKRLAEILGVDPKTLAPRTGVDIRKPLADDTTSHLANKLGGAGGASGQGGATAPKSARPADAASILLAMLPGRTNPANSREIKAFFEGRKNRSGSALPVFITIQQPKSP
jgi:hypothetical protein